MIIESVDYLLMQKDDEPSIVAVTNLDECLSYSVALRVSDLRELEDSVRQLQHCIRQGNTISLDLPPLKHSHLSLRAQSSNSKAPVPLDLYRLAFLSFS